MITFNKLLVCLDLSVADQAVIQNACEIAKRAETTEVTFLNVIKDFNLPESLEKEFPDLIDKAITERREKIQEAIASGFDCDQIKTSVEIRKGNATKEILSCSVKVGADLIVIGRKKENSSVLKTRIVRRAACNILLVPENSSLKFDKIHVPVDFSNYSDLSLDTALSLTGEEKVDILLQNVYNVPSSYRYSGKTYDEFSEIMREHSSKDLGVLLKKATITNQNLIPIHTLDDGQNVTKMVYDEAAKQNANLIVMGAKGRTAASALFIGSKAERMIQVNDSIPMIVARKKGANAGILESLQDL